MTKEEMYYDHYKDTFTEQKGYLTRRNRLTIYLFALLLLFGFLLDNPQQIETLVNKLIDSKVKDVKFSFDCINLLFEIVFLWVVVSYYQINFTVERTYKYIHSLEEKLVSQGYNIEREGKHYKEYHPILLDIVHWFYILALPVMVITMSVIKISHRCDYDFVCLRVFILLIVIVLSVSYLIRRCFK